MYFRKRKCTYFIYNDLQSQKQGENMSEQIEIELSEETSQIIFENYEQVKDKYESFDEYMQELNTWLNLKMKQLNLKAELQSVNDELNSMKTSSGA